LYEQSTLESAVLAVRDWYAANGMLSNADKSSAILVSHCRKFFTANTFLVAGTIVPIKNTLTALGAIWGLLGANWKVLYWPYETGMRQNGMLLNAEQVFCHTCFSPQKIPHG